MRIQIAQGFAQCMRQISLVTPGNSGGDLNLVIYALWSVLIRLRGSNHKSGRHEGGGGGGEGEGGGGGGRGREGGAEGVWHEVIKILNFSAIQCKFNCCLRNATISNDVVKQYHLIFQIHWVSKLWSGKVKSYWIYSKNIWKTSVA